MKIQFLKSHLTPKSGYGEHARNLAAALIKNGIDVLAVDDTKKHLDLNGITLTGKIRKQLPIIYSTFSFNKYALIPGQYSILTTMLETERVHPNLVDKFNNADAVWVATKFNYETFLKSGVRKDKLSVVRSPVDIKQISKRAYQLKTEKTFRFLSIFSPWTTYRKGVDVLLRAYLKAFTINDDVCLVVKTNMTKAQLFRKCGIKKQTAFAEIEVINKHLSDDEMSGLYQSASAYVLPSRGEGTGRPYLYAMLNELPVIATGWSGNMEFMNKKNSFLIKYALKDVPFEVSKMLSPVYFGSRLAEPDESDLTEKMMYVYKNYEKAKEKGKLARKEVLKKYSYKAVARQAILALKKSKKKKDKKPPIDIFYKLLPLYFPDREHGFIEEHKIIINSNIKKIAIYGTGQGAKYAYAWIKRFKKIEKIIFCDNDSSKKRYLGRKVIHYTKLGGEDLDLIVIGAKEIFIDSILKKIKKKVKVPVYHFCHNY